MGQAIIFELKANPADYDETVEIEERVDCDECEGTGRVGCEECNGTGLVECDVCMCGTVTKEVVITIEEYEERQAQERQELYLRRRYGSKPADIRDYWMGENVVKNVDKWGRPLWRK